MPEFRDWLSTASLIPAGAAGQLLSAAELASPRIAAMRTLCEDKIPVAEIAADEQLVHTLEQLGMATQLSEQDFARVFAQLVSNADSAGCRLDHWDAVVVGALWQVATDEQLSQCPIPTHHGALLLPGGQELDAALAPSDQQDLASATNLFLKLGGDVADVQICGAGRASLVLKTGTAVSLVECITARHALGERREPD